jgi:hypothetical protein
MYYIFLLDLIFLLVLSLKKIIYEWNKFDELWVEIGYIEDLEVFGHFSKNITCR